MKNTILNLFNNIKKILHFTIVVLCIMTLLFGGLYVAILNLINYPFVFAQIILSIIGIYAGYMCFMVLFKGINYFK